MSRLTYEWLDPTVSPVPPPSWLRMLRPPAQPPVTPRNPALKHDGDRPGDLLAASTSWHEILEPIGWTLVGSRGNVGHWRRPGKLGGTISATTNARGTDRLHVFSSNASPFEPDTSYTKFAAFALLAHGGNFSAAARALRTEAVTA